MTSATRMEKIYFAVVFLNAVWIGLAGLFLPAQLAAIFTWMTLPPLHARFLGAIYLFGALLMIGSFLANRWTQVQAALYTAAIWTGLIFVVSVLHRNSFDFSQFSTWVWFIAYFIFPVAALWLAWTRAQRAAPVGTGRLPMPSWVRGFLLAQGGVMIVLAVALLVVPDLVATVWPWKLTASLAQFYSGPLLAYGYSSVQFARAGTWADLRVLLPGMLVFTACALIASVIHSNLFSTGDVSDWLWFASLIIATALLGITIVRGLSNTEINAAVPTGGR
jgi:hypothetical protein